MSKKKKGIKPRGSTKQKIFEDEYIANGLNATQAAIAAGYSEKTAYSIGHRLLKKDDVQKSIAQKVKERFEAAAMNADYVLERITTLAETSMQMVPIVDKDGVPKTDESGNQVYVAVDAQSALQAYNLLGKYLKLFTEKIEHSVTDNLAERLAKAKRRKIEE